jgi:adenosylcobalamin-dependent ribonucleoside-triphosphate reductase
MDELFSFRLSEEFFEGWLRRPVRWGFDIGHGNSLGEIVFLSKYSRRTDSGRKETWAECVRRVVEGTFSTLYDHCKATGRPWDRWRLRADAEAMFAGMFEMRWLPPGRGIWMMGTQFVLDEGGAALQNCAFLSTRRLGCGQTWEPFARLMEMSMLGIGVGFDTCGRDQLRVGTEPIARFTYRVADTREGWCASLRMLLQAYLCPGSSLPLFDYGSIRPAGRRIVRFGGVSAGAEPLRVLHSRLRTLLAQRANSLLSSVDIVDMMNMIGKCVALGNIGRSAEIALGTLDDSAFLDLKNPRVNPARLGRDGWGHVSNNSVVVEPGDDYSRIADRIADNGEPGLFFRSSAQRFGRFADPPDERDSAAAGTNPCAEQTLEDHECCTLVETFPTRHDSIGGFGATLRLALLYAKAVTLVPTRWPDVNEVMSRNRRIGCSISGLAQLVDTLGYDRAAQWLDRSYTVVRAVDRGLSSWLDVPQSVKLTSVKPSGTISLLAGVSPGVHFHSGSPGGGAFIRRLRCGAAGPLTAALATAGYRLEPDIMDPSRLIAELPVDGQGGRVAAEVPITEKVRLAAMLQRFWADNQVSVTVTFSEAEAPALAPLLSGIGTELKAVSFLPLVEGGAYAQMPFEPVDADRHMRMREHVQEFDRDLLYGEAAEPEGELYCENDSCQWPAAATARGGT